ncbi:hypothetical protein TNIN_53211 [Trichonephila inaurata madagascariensis]|uniref:Uncharacterized protein n=1 Tax=Trichonephila inaurata madagascariensis TaxID=2747483 RepID=A0A8X6YC69_9ARAC|nr:hypothetical protein TNIN_53211 [Trichonephila inaurata madagascariensis]
MRGLTPELPPEPSQQFLRYLSNMRPDILLQEDAIFIQYAQPFSSDGFALPWQSCTITIRVDDLSTRSRLLIRITPHKSQYMVAMNLQADGVTLNFFSLGIQGISTP